MPRNPGLNKSFLDDTPSDGGERRPNRSAASRGRPATTELGPTKQPFNAEGTPSAPDGTVDATTAQSRRRFYQPGELAHTPSMDGPAATRPMKKTHKPLSSAEAPAAALAAD